MTAGSVASARAQDTESTDPPRFTYGAEFSATIAAKDDGYFNYTDYEYSLLRLITGAFVGAIHVNEHLQILGEARLQNDRLQNSALYARVRPSPGWPVAILVGRIPPTFGRFGRQTYGRSNLLIGTPLAYQYLTTLRANEVPVGTDALLRVRGRGWLVTYPSAVSGSGTPHAEAGLPIMASSRWDTGIQVNAELGLFESSVAFTNGSLSNPRVSDDNDGKQFAGRVTVHPLTWAEFGASVSRGAFLHRSVTAALPTGTIAGDYVQVAAGADAELSAGHWVVRSEIVRSSWRLPALGAPAPERVAAIAALAEASYRAGPRWRPAIRLEHLTFSELESSTRERVSWDAPVSRLEIALGYAVSRHLTARTAWQYNWRTSVSRPLPREGFLAFQVSAWY